MGIWFFSFSSGAKKRNIKKDGRGKKKKGGGVLDAGKKVGSAREVWEESIT